MGESPIPMEVVSSPDNCERTIDEHLGIPHAFYHSPLGSSDTAGELIQRNRSVDIHRSIAKGLEVTLLNEHLVQRGRVAGCHPCEEALNDRENAVTRSLSPQG
jgi:hypothetical protein